MQAVAGSPRRLREPRWYNPAMSGRERIFRTEAVILRRQDLGEADRLVVAYSPDRGKLRLVAKGVRRLNSRKAGHLEPFSRTSLLIARGRELDIISQAEAVETYPALQTDLLRVGQASYVVELIDRFTFEEGGSRPAYALLLETLGRLAEGRSGASDGAAPQPGGAQGAASLPAQRVRSGRRSERETGRAPGSRRASGSLLASPAGAEVEQPA